MPADWGRFDLSQLSRQSLLEDGWGEVSSPGSDERLAVASRFVGSNTLIQVGRSTQLQEELLARFRDMVLLLFASVVLVAIVGGRLLTWIRVRAPEGAASVESGAAAA